MIISCRGRVSIGSPESGVRRRVQKHSWKAPGSSVALPEMSGKVAGGFGSVSKRIRKDFMMILWWLCCQNSPGTSFEAGRSPRARASGRRRVLWRRVERALDGSRRLCGGSREVWEGCRRFWRGSGEVLGGLGGGGGSRRGRISGPLRGRKVGR